MTNNLHRPDRNQRAQPLGDLAFVQVYNPCEVDVDGDRVQLRDGFGEAGQQQVPGGFGEVVDGGIAHTRIIEHSFVGNERDIVVIVRAKRL